MFWIASHPRVTSLLISFGFTFSFAMTRPSELENTRDIVIDLFIYTNRLGDILTNLDQVDATRNLLFYSFFRTDSSVLLPDFFLIIGNRIGEGDLHEESIELCFRKRIGSLVFDRILGCKDEK